MNKKLLFAILISAMTTGCAASKTAPDIVMDTDMDTEMYADADFIAGKVPGCHSPEPPPAHNCHNSATARNSLTINTNPPFLTAMPKVACVNRGATVNIHITPATGKVTVISAPKDPKDPKNDWIYGSNIEFPELMKIEVPQDAVVDSEPEYLIVASNGKCLDPKFHVD